MFNFGGSGGFGFFDEAATVEYNSSWTILSFGDVGLSIDGNKTTFEFVQINDSIFLFESNNQYD